VTLLRSMPPRVQTSLIVRYKKQSLFGSMNRGAVTPRILIKCLALAIDYERSKSERGLLTFAGKAGTKRQKVTTWRYAPTVMYSLMQLPMRSL
jgi:hypothetical protein